MKNKGDITMKIIMLTMMAVLLPVLNIKTVAAETVPLLIHEHNKINVFDACAYFSISDFSTLNDFSENTLYTHSKNEVTGSVKNGVWEYEYIEPYNIQIPDKTIPYTIEECKKNNVTKKNECNNVTLYNRTYKEKTRYKSSWLNASKLLTDSSKLSGIRSKPTQNIRFCADIERVWTSKGFTIKVDIIPYFDGVIYDKYVWFDNSFGFKMSVLGFCPHCSTDEEFMLLVNNDTSNIGVFVNGSLEIFWGNFTINSTWQIIGYIYFNDFTDYVLVDPTETHQIEMFIDEGNSTDFGVPEKDLIFWLHLNGTDGFDSSLYSHALVSTGGTPIREAGKIGHGVEFVSASSEVLNYGDIDAADGTASNELEIMAWVNLTDSTGGPDMLVSKFGTPAPRSWFFASSSGGITYEFGGTGTNLCRVGSFPGNNGGGNIVGVSTTVGDWIHISIGANLTDCWAYINGVRRDSSLWAQGSFGNDAFPVQIAGNPAGFFPDAIIDDVRIYNRSLSAAEHLMIFNNTAGIHNITDIGDIEIRPPIPPPPPPPIHSFIIYKLISPPIPFISWFLETLTFKAVILFMDRLTVTGNVDIGGNLTVTNNVNVGGDLNVTGNWSGNDFYGEMWFHNDLLNTTTIINTQFVWVNLTGFDNGELNGQTLNGFTYLNDTLTAQVAGKYDVEYSLSFGNVGNNQEYQIAIAVNESIQNQTDTHRKVGAAGDVGNTGSSGFIDLLVGDHVHLMIRNTDGTGNVLSHSANVNLIRIGD